MKPTRFLPTASLLLLLVFSGCAGIHWHAAFAPAAKPITGPDLFGDHAEKMVWLDQGWMGGENNWFYNTTQGSQLLPYAFFLHLEQAGNQKLFRYVDNIRRFRYLPESPNLANPDGLPIGFVADKGSSIPASMLADRRSLGMTCAACHTAQLNYRGTAMRIDGGPTLADFSGFMDALSASLDATMRDGAKFERFAAGVLGNGASAEKKFALRQALTQTAKERAAYNKLNHSDVPYGYARLDAFGRIFNNALQLVDKSNGVKANAPVSYPHLWDSPREDYVQWTGVASNHGPGPLGRNVGEVVGVFARLDTSHTPASPGYASSVHLPNLIKLEKQLRLLQSPQWPENILPPIDAEMSKAGGVLFGEHCADCHYKVKRTDPSRRLVTVSKPINELRTDPLTAENIINRRGNTGYLNGTWRYVFAGDRFGPTDSAFGIVGNTVLRTIVGKTKHLDRAGSVPVSASLVGGVMSDSVNTEVHDPENVVRLSGAVFSDTFEADSVIRKAGVGPKLQYKARPLNGIWATAPFLHNGSVPNLYQLLLPEGQRAKRFAIGRREFDPVNVGLDTRPAPGTFTFDTTRPGNSNSGHNYGANLSELQRRQLLEYLKSL